LKNGASRRNSEIFYDRLFSFLSILSGAVHYAGGFLFILQAHPFPLKMPMKKSTTLHSMTGI
jgi:hypothetical protein